jgi:hypothetical protein
MNLAELSLVDLFGTLVGFFFTLCVFSYIFGDNVLFRIAIYVFVGVSAGYAAVITWNSVILSQMIKPILGGPQSERLLALMPLLLSVLLFFKLSNKMSGVGNLPVAFMVGVGAAAAIGGGVLGSLIPQMSASINMFDLQLASQRGDSWLGMLGKGSVVLIGTITTLVYFHFGARRIPGSPPRRLAVIEILGWIGQIFIAVTLGAIFAGVYAASLMAFIERLNSLLDFFLLFLPK